jgi:hypothetical protein
VKVQYSYQVCAVDAKDALSTVPQVIKMRYIGVHAEGLTEILDAPTKEVVLRAQLNPDPPSPSSNEKNTLYIL